MQEKSNLLELTANIAAAYVGNNTVAQADLPKLIANIYQSLAAAPQSSAENKQAETAELKPAVPVRKSITPDYIICLEDGKKFKSLKRHLRTHYDLSPEQYREKWGLPLDYPMVAPNYAEARSSLAKKIGLGQNRAERR
ncbi:MucR family transcriptional regulator [Taklimakanibacter deserti]|uniref:MucR family transcriptional regulator n=1 Tax=Taklimakanibacter deserti TaxID=2267839 RepID=UPI000E649A95